MATDKKDGAKSRVEMGVGNGGPGGNRRNSANPGTGSGGAGPGRVPLSAVLTKEAERQVARQIVIPAVKGVLEKVPPSDRRWDCIHPSEMCSSSWCSRATYYRITGRRLPYKPIEFNLASIFAEGNFIHEKWQAWLRKTGNLWGRWHCRNCDKRMIGTEPTSTTITCCTDPYLFYEEVPLDNDDYNIHGFEDGALWTSKALIEFKSVGMGTLRKEAPEALRKYYIKMGTGGIYDLDRFWKDLQRPFPSHVRQANVYLWLAKKMGLPFDRCQVVYEFKPNQQAKEFTVRMSDDIILPMLDKAEDIRIACTTGIPPSCPNGGCAECLAYESL